MNAPKHLAEQSTTARIREHRAAQQAGFGISKEGRGKHRSEETTTEAEAA